MHEITTARACPWCRGRRGRTIWRGAGYVYVRCRTCGGIFANLTDREYERARHNAWDEENPTEAALAFYGSARERAHAEFLDAHPPAGNGRLLDVGCGLGCFLAAAERHGWDVHGVDTSPAWVDAANARLGSERVQLGSADLSTLAPGSFALVTAWRVIEHIFDPRPFLARLRQLLAPEGRLFLRTPNIAYGDPVYAVRRWLLRHDVELGPTNHVVYLSARTMRAASRLPVSRRARGRCSSRRRLLPPPRIARPAWSRRRTPMRGSRAGWHPRRAGASCSAAISTSSAGCR